jgi:hypothetical protein
MAEKKPKRQDSTVLSKTLAGQLSKSEKRSNIASDMRALKEQAHQAVKQVKLNARLAKNV